MLFRSYEPRPFHENRVKILFRKEPNQKETITKVHTVHSCQWSLYLTQFGFQVSKTHRPPNKFDNDGSRPRPSDPSLCFLRKPDIYPANPVLNSLFLILTIRFHIFIHEVLKLKSFYKRTWYITHELILEGTSKRRLSIMGIRRRRALPTSIIKISMVNILHLFITLSQLRFLFFREQTGFHFLFS